MIEEFVGKWTKWAKEGDWFRIPIAPWRAKVAGQEYSGCRVNYFFRAPEMKNMILYLDRMGFDVYHVG